MVFLIALVLQGPILARNITQFDSVRLTSQAGAYALLWLAPLVLEAKDGTPHALGAAQMTARYEAERAGPQSPNRFEESAGMTAAAGRELSELGTGAIAKAWFFGAAINLASPAVILAPAVSRLPRTGFFDVPGDSKTDKILSFLFRNDNPVYAWVLAIGLIGVAAARAVQLGGLIIAIATPSRAVRDTAGRRETRLFLLFLLLWVAYILLVNGPIASPKYRLPIEPVAAVFFAMGFSGLTAWFASRRRRTSSR